MTDTELIEKLTSTLNEMVLDVRDIKLVLRGYNGGTKGLCKQFEDLATDYYQFKRKVFLVIGIMIGSGMLSTGVLGYFIGV